MKTGTETRPKHVELIVVINKKNGESVPLQAWSGPEGSRKLSFPIFRDNGTGWW